jgi:hypothetical protein
VSTQADRSSPGGQSAEAVTTAPGPAAGRVAQRSAPSPDLGGSALAVPVSARPAPAFAARVPAAHIRAPRLDPPPPDETTQDGTPRAAPAPVPPVAPAEKPFRAHRTRTAAASTRMLGLCGWATTLGVLGLGSALRGLVAIWAHGTPAWYEPTVGALGLGGIGLTTAAFLAARRRRLPWVLLGLASVPLAVNLGLTIAAL